jgi:hypothetical protein
MITVNQKLFAKHGKPYYVKNIDQLFSRFIRQWYWEQGITYCVTHGKAYDSWKELQQGHYIKRGHWPTRWLIENCAPQCGICNKYGAPNLPRSQQDEGQPDAMRKFLVSFWGEKRVQEIEALKHQKNKSWTKLELAVFREELLIKIKEHNYE